VPLGRESVFLVNPLGRLSDPKEFEKIIISAAGDGAVVHFRDVGTAKFGDKPIDGTVRVAGAPGVALAVSGDAAAARRVKEALPDLRKKLPEGVTLGVALDLSADEAVRVELRGPDSASEERMARIVEAAAERLKGLDGVTVALSEAH